MSFACMAEKPISYILTTACHIAFAAAAIAAGIYHFFVYDFDFIALVGSFADLFRSL